MSTWIYEGRLKSSNDDISAVDDFFWWMGFKHCNTDGRCMWTARSDYIEKQTSYSHESILVSLPSYILK